MTKPGPVHERRHPDWGTMKTLRYLGAQPHPNVPDGSRVAVVDWFDRVTGVKVRDVFGSSRTAAKLYMRRVQRRPMDFPKDDEIVMVSYPGVGFFAVHQKELHDAREGQHPTSPTAPDQEE